ncbi:FMN-linked oxidoreductase [Infundibulicybe gibba]|nr:FMN-linked oxidoreductase [Infundibulicybe gibba]
MSQQKLFQPIQVGCLTLQHRVVLAPLTRFKSGYMDHVPTVPLMKEYYTQRATTPGTLLISEATIIAAQAGGYANIPGIWSQPQIDAWKQLWALGRAANPDILAAEDPSFPHISASNIKLSSSPASEPAPRALTLSEINEYVALYAQAARNAIKAGFDGVEIGGASGYLIDQFLQDVSNIREDEYGGSVENRNRFALRVVDAVANAIDMGMADPLPQFTHLISTLARTHTDLAYIHLIEPRFSGLFDRAPAAYESNAAFRAAWAPRPIINAGGYDRAGALAAAKEEGNVLVAFGRHYISNPDLPKRLKKNIPLTPYNRKTFYTPIDEPGAAYGGERAAIVRGVVWCVEAVYGCSSVAVATKSNVAYIGQNGVSQRQYFFGH